MITNTTKPVAHTPTPWEQHGCAVYQADKWEDGVNNGGRLIANTFPYETEPTIYPNDQDEANAQLIVRAVNCHAALVEALEGCLESMAKVRQDPYTTCACAEQLALAHRHAQNALALAKEQS